MQGELVEVEGEDGDQHEGHQRRQLRGRGHDVDERRLLHPAQDERVQGPQRDRRADHRLDVVALAEEGEEERQRAEDGDRVGDVAHPGADPVAPGRLEAHVRSEASPCIGVGAAVQRRLACRQALVDEGQHQHADASDGPTDHDRAWRGVGGHVAGKAEDAAADHRTDDEAHERQQRELAGRLRRCLRAGRRLAPWLDDGRRHASLLLGEGSQWR